MESSLAGVTFTLIVIIVFFLIMYYVVKWAVRDGILKALGDRSTPPLVDKLLTNLRAPEPPR